MGRWYYLGPWVAETKPFPHYRAPSWAIGSIDLRPSMPTTTHGFFTSDHAILDSDYEPFGDASGTRLEGLTMSPTQRSRWASMLGIAETPVAGSLLDLLWNTLTVYSDPDGVTHARPIMPTVDGVLELHLGGHSLVRASRIPRDVTLTPHWDKMQRVLQASYRDVEMQSRGGANPKARQVHQRWLGAMRDKYGLTDDQAMSLLVPSDLPRVKPIKPETTITENFNQADSTTVGPGLTWNELAGPWSTVSNKLSYDDTTGAADGRIRAESDLSSSDNYAKIDLVTAGSGGNHGAGPCCRYSGAAQTFYQGWYFNDGNVYFSKVSAGTRTNLSSVAQAFAAVAVKVTINGSSWAINWNGSDILTGTDSAIASGTRGGAFGYNDGGAGPTMDNFEAADLAAGSTTRGTPFGHRGTAFNGGRTFMGILR